MKPKKHRNSLATSFSHFVLHAFIFETLIPQREKKNQTITVQPAEMWLTKTQWCSAPLKITWYHFLKKFSDLQIF